MSLPDAPWNAASRGALGGAADELGGDLRASVAAWAVSFGLAGRPLPIGELPQDESSVPAAVRLETDAPVDDIQIDLRGGGRLFVQVKSSLSVSRSDPTFVSVLGQFSAAVKELHLDIGRDRLVLAVGRKTGPLDALFHAWQRSKTSLAGQPTGQQRKALALVDELTPTLSELERDILRKVSCGVEFSTNSEIAAQSVLASAVVAPSDTARAFRELKAISRDLAKYRLGLRIEEWAERLVRSKINLTCDPNGSDAARWEARRRAVRRYRADLVRRVITLDLRPLGAAVPPMRHRLGGFRVQEVNRSSKSSRDESALDVAARRRGRILLLGLPGSGKSTALRYLGAEWARDLDAPLPVLVSLRDFVQLLATQHPFDAFIRAALLNVRAFDRPLLTEEFRLRAADGRIAFLFDALDETREARFRVVQATEHVLRELHRDATVVLTTRDSGYAAASTLKMEQFRLRPFRTPEYTLRRILQSFATKHRLPEDQSSRWINDRLSWIESALERDHDLAETPLGGILLALLAAEPTRHALPRGRAKTLSAVVDGVVERWELSQRQLLSEIQVGALRATEAAAGLKESFAQIGYAILHRSDVTAHDVRSDLAVWLRDRWALSAGQADSTGREMFAFWDEAGIFIASEATETVTARIQLLAEIGAARYIASLEPAAIPHEIHRFASSEVLFEVASLAAGLSEHASSALVTFCTSQAQVKWDLKAAKHLRDGSAHPQSAIDVAEALARDAKGAANEDERWDAAKTVALLPLSLAFKRNLLKQFKDLLSDERHLIAEAMCEASECSPISEPAAVLQGVRRTLRPGKDSIRRGKLLILPEDDDVGDLLVYITEHVLPHRPEIADAVVEAGDHGSSRLWERLDAALTRIGRSDIVASRNRNLYKSFEEMGRSFETMQRDWLRFLSIIGDLAPAKPLSFRESWRLDELVDFFATLRVCTSEAGAISSALYYSEEDVRSLVRLASTLGRFNAAVLAAESRIAIALEERRRSTTLLCEGGNRRELRNWEDAEGNSIDVAIDLVGGTSWLSRIASEALARCQSPGVSDRIEKVLGEIRPINKLHAGSAIIDLGDEVGDRAIKWQQSTDPFTRQLAAWWFAHQESDATGEHVERALTDSDRGVRVAAVRGLRRRTLPEALRTRLQALASHDAPVGYVCMHCGTVNPAESMSCTKCNIVGPELETEVQKVVDPDSKSGFNDDEGD
ncbi:MAG TPA: NACHT domain-containing protein [Vicinamibacterales bacterium]|nr:NACHT domain-containing protein [Vicinamibacterales bacterium]